MTNTNNVQLLLDGKEIEPTGAYDFSFRRVPTAKVNYFRGLPSQMTVNPDDKNRIQLWYGDKLGHHEETVLKTDFNTPEYLAAFKNISVDCLSKKLSNESFTLDPESYGVAYLRISDTVTLNLMQPVNAGTRIQIFFENSYRNPVLKFNENLKIRWLNKEPELPKDAGKTYCITFTWNGSEWLAGQDSSDSGSGVTSDEISACLNASVMSLGYCLPAGASGAGEYASKYALFSGIANFSDDELINIAQAATNIGNINDVANSKDAINTVEDNLAVINDVAAKLPKIEKLLARYEALAAKDASGSDTTGTSTTTTDTDTTTETGA